MAGAAGLGTTPGTPRTRTGGGSFCQVEGSGATDAGVASSGAIGTATDPYQPAEFEVAFELLRFDPKIDHVAVSPNKRMKRLHVRRCRTILFAAINFDRAGLAQFDRNDTWHRIYAEEHRVFFEFHESSTDRADFRRFQMEGGARLYPKF